MKLQIVGINYAPEIISIAVYSTGLAEHMAKQGVEVSVVTAQPYFPAWKVMEGWPKFWYRGETSDSGVRIMHCPHYVPSNPTGSRRILHHATFALTALPVILWQSLFRRPDVVFCVAPSMIASPVALLGARLSGAVSWLHIQDYEVEAAFATGLIDGKSRVGRWAEAFERWVLRRYDRISSISEPMLEKLEEKEVEKGREFELRNWADLGHIQPLEGVSAYREEFGIETKYVAVYSGNLANKQGLEILPDLARALAHRDDLTIVVCGDGPMRQDLLDMAKGVENIEFFPLQPWERLSELLGMADVHLLPQIAGAADLMLPSKLTNMLASGRPVVATTRPDTALGHEVEGCGYATPPGDAAKMAEAVEHLLDNPEERMEMGRAARARALERWDGDAILGRLKAAFERLVADRAQRQ